MAVNDFTGKNIQDTYQRVVQTDGTNLADGTGSLLPISFEGNNVRISGSIFATEYSVTSSVTNVVIATKSGSTAFGNSSDDTHTFTGNITASGNISQSNGKLFTNQIELVGNNIVHGGDVGLPIQANHVQITNPDNGPISAANVRSRLHVDGDITINTHITASGNISASGMILHDHITFNTTTNTLKGLYFQDTGTKIEGDTNYILIDGDNQISMLADSSIQIVTPTIVQTGNISASGDIYGSSIYTSIAYRLEDSGGTSRHIIRSQNNEIEIGNSNFTDGISLTGNVTASGNISASATSTVQAGSGSFHILKGDTTAATGLSISGYIEATNITSSGNISSSGGTITAHTFNSNGVNLLGYLNDTINIGPDATTPVKIHGNITASGNISSSGTITADQMTYGTPGSGHVTLGASDGDILGYETDSSTNKAFMLSNHSAGGKLSLYTGNTLHNFLTYTGDSYVNGTNNANGFVVGGTSTDNKFEVVGTTKLGGHVTASGHISGSATSLITAQDLTLVRQLTVPTIINVNTTHVTASGNISASGIVSASKFHGDGSGLSNVSSTAPAGTISGSEHIFTAITASGNISASGNIIAVSASIQHLDGPEGGGISFASGNPTLKGEDGAQISLTDDATISGGNNRLIVNEILNVNTTHITASGNISSSGKFIGAEISASTAVGGLTLTGNITASGNISSSGTITALSGSFTNYQGDFLSITSEEQKIGDHTGINTQTNIKLRQSLGRMDVNCLNGTEKKITLSAKDLIIDDENGTTTQRTRIQGHVTASGNISASGDILARHITASSNISASGNIFGDQYKTKGQTLGLYHVGSSTIRLADYSQKTEIYGTNIELKAPVTASGNISASGTITADDGSGNEFTVRPNLYFFATNTSAITMNGGSDYGAGTTDNEGSLPATNATTVTLTQEQNSHTSVFSLSSNRVTIARAGLYKITYNALLEINNGSNRIEGFVGLVQETSGGTVTLVDGTEGRGYHRFVHSARPSGQTYAASVIVNVAANSIYDLRFGITKQSIATQKLRTMPTGTSFLIEAIT